MKWKASASLSRTVDQFFETHQKSLELNYPGITPAILKRHFVHSFLNDCLGNEAWLDFAYFHRADSVFDHVFTSLRQGIPLAHIFEGKFFFRSDFYVSPDVLIPRDETEILVELVLKDLKLLARRQSRPKVLEVGVGSGAIMLSVIRDFKKPVDFWAGDIDVRALKIAKINDFRLSYVMHPEAKRTFILSDRLQQVTEQFDLIVSNPPYIKRHADRHSVHSQVDRFEPEVALYLDDDAYLEWFTTFFDQCFEHLMPSGCLLMEGHENHLPSLKSLAENCGFDKVAIICDYTGRWRFLRAERL